MLVDPTKGIDLQGISGSLKLDPTTGAAPQSVQLPCPDRGPDRKSRAFVGSGLYYDAETNGLRNVNTVFNPATTQCPYLK